MAGVLVWKSPGSRQVLPAVLWGLGLVLFVLALRGRRQRTGTAPLVAGPADDDFAAGLTHLLQEDRWREQGEAARSYIGETFEQERAIDAHLAVYHHAMNHRAASP